MLDVFEEVMKSSLLLQLSRNQECYPVKTLSDVSTFAKLIFKCILNRTFRQKDDRNYQMCRLIPVCGLNRVHGVSCKSRNAAVGALAFVP
jgi:hypothetical protein